MAGFECGKLDISKLNPSDLVSGNNQIWVKTEVDEKIYIWDRNNDNSPEPYVVLKFGDACFPKLCEDNLFTYASIQALLNALDIKNIANAIPVDKNTSRDQKAKNFCQQLNEAQKAGLMKNRGELDNTASNTFRFQPAAVMPTVGVVSMKSNIKTYGPYASSNFGNSCGGTRVEVETDLAPWVFGSIQDMNTAGNSLVESSSIGLIRAETGSVTIPGLPTIQNIGAVLGSSGPNLSNINFTFGASGISTNYTFKTYTPKFGSLNRHFLDKFKTVAKNRNQLLKFLRSNQITQNKINRQIRKNNAINKPDNPKDKLPSNKPSLQRIIAGEIRFDEANDENARTKVGFSTLGDIVGEMIYDYNKKAFMSLDGLYGPVSIGGDGGLPRFAQASTDPYKQSLSKNPYPPFKSNYYDDINNLNIDKTHLNPLTNIVDQNNHYHSGPGCGHVIDLVGREIDVPESGLITNFYNQDDANRYSNDYRFLAMRGPLVLHSWGYDTDGKPIPNESDNDTDTQAGNFTTNNLKDSFLENWLGKPVTWPVAPIDLRFDRNRGVWVSPPSPSIITATLDTRLEANNSCEASIVFDQGENSIYDKDGNVVQNGKITVYDKLGCSYKKDTKIYAYFNTCLNKYIVLEACEGEGDDYCPPKDPLDSFTIGKLDLQMIPGWNQTVAQILGHDTEGCLKWIDTNTCETPTPTP